MLERNSYVCLGREDKGLTLNNFTTGAAPHLGKHLPMCRRRGGCSEDGVPAFRNYSQAGREDTCA